MADAYRCDGCDELNDGSPNSRFVTDEEGSMYDAGIEVQLCDDCTEETLRAISRLDESALDLAYGTSEE